jgi:hypothetical protein
MSLEVEAMASSETGFVELAAPEVQTGTVSRDRDPANDWLCAWCLTRVASEKDRVRHGGQSEFTFKNPQGIWFHLLTFSRTYGCRQVGIPTLEYTWFPGHAWSCCVCDSCGMHLGWYYSGPTEFVGLIRDRLVRAVLIRN